jgi:hypothetical protein
MDITTAFLYGDLQEEIYMRIPEGCAVKSEMTGKVCKLNKSLYGLKQAPRQWNHKLDNSLQSYGLLPSDGDPCLYYLVKEGLELYVAVFVDDMLIVCNSIPEAQKLKERLKLQYALKDMGELRYFLGIEVKRCRTTRRLFLSQRKYTGDILERFGMMDCKPVFTPMNPGEPLSAQQSPQTAAERDEMESYPYRAVVGSLMYLMVTTRPDLAYAVSMVSRYMDNPGMAHWRAAKWILRYLKGTQDYCLTFTGSDPEALYGYSDSDWAGDLDERKSTYGFIFFLAGNAVMWASKRQKSVALSSTEAEFIGASEATRELLWLRKVAKALGVHQDTPLILHEDNQGAISLAKEESHKRRTKHLDVRYHFVRQCVQSGLVQLVYCRTEEMVADFLTKAVSRTVIRRHCASLRLGTSESEEGFVA